MKKYTSFLWNNEKVREELGRHWKVYKGFEIQFYKQQEVKNSLNHQIAAASTSPSIAFECSQIGTIAVTVSEIRWPSGLKLHVGPSVVCRLWRVTKGFEGNEKLEKTGSQLKSEEELQKVLKTLEGYWRVVNGCVVVWRFLKELNKYWRFLMVPKEIWRFF